MKSEISEDSLFEALFEQAVKDNFQEEVAKYQQEAKGAEAPVFSKQYENRMKKLFRVEKRQQYAPFIRAAGRVAACIAVVLALALGALLLSPEVRAAVFELFVEQFGGYRAFSSNVPAENVPEQLWIPTYIPEGYEVEYEHYDTTSTITYMNGSTEKEGWLIHFGANDIGSKLMINSENVEPYKIHKNGITYYVSKATKEDEYNSLVWVIGRTRFDISSFESVDELLKIAESVMKK